MLQSTVFVIFSYQVQKLQREYERLHKRHTKHKKDVERDKEKSVLEFQDSMAEVHKLTKKVEVGQREVCTRVSRQYGGGTQTHEDS